MSSELVVNNEGFLGIRNENGSVVIQDENGNMVTPERFSGTDFLMPLYNDPEPITPLSYLLVQLTDEQLDRLATMVAEKLTRKLVGFKIENND